MDFVKRKPDYRLAAQTKSGDKIKGNIGAAWIGESGRISIHLDPFVVISQAQNLQITLFPNTESE